MNIRELRGGFPAETFCLRAHLHAVKFAQSQAVFSACIGFIVRLLACCVYYSIIRISSLLILVALSYLFLIDRLFAYHFHRSFILILCLSFVSSHIIWELIHISLLFTHSHDFFFLRLLGYCLYQKGIFTSHIRMLHSSFLSLHPEVCCVLRLSCNAKLRLLKWWLHMRLQVRVSIRSGCERNTSSSRAIEDYVAGVATSFDRVSVNLKLPWLIQKLPFEYYHACVCIVTEISGFIMI